MTKKNIFAGIFAVILFTPQMVLAAWWNPTMWFKTKQPIKQETLNVETVNSDTTHDLQGPAVLSASSSNATCIALTKNLSIGMEDKSSNSEILRLQKFLFDKKYLTNTPNGYYGAGTVAAVKKFQVDNTVTSDGVINSGTRTKIKEISCKQANITPENSTDKNQQAQPVAKNTKINKISPSPSLLVSANPMIVEPEKTTVVTWKSTNTTECFIEGKGQNSVRGKQRRKSQGEQEIGVGTSLLTISVSCTGENGKSISKELLIRTKSPQEPSPEAKQSAAGVGRYEMYMSGHLSMVSYLTKTEAQDHCINITHKNNPNNSIECMWGNEKIYSFYGDKTKLFWKNAGGDLPDLME